MFILRHCLSFFSRSRLKTLLDSLEKLNSGTGGKPIKSKEDELSQYRYTTAKILQCIETQGTFAHQFLQRFHFASSTN